MANPLGPRRAAAPYRARLRRDLRGSRRPAGSATQACPGGGAAADRARDPDPRPWQRGRFRVRADLGAAQARKSPGGGGGYDPGHHRRTRTGRNATAPLVVGCLGRRVTGHYHPARSKCTATAQTGRPRPARAPVTTVGQAPSMADGRRIRHRDPTRRSAFRSPASSPPAGGYAASLRVAREAAGDPPVDTPPEPVARYIRKQRYGPKIERPRHGVSAEAASRIHPRKGSCCG